MKAVPGGKFAVLGAGAVGGFGCGRADLMHALAAPQTPAVAQPLLADLSSLERFVPKRQLRRYDRHALLALSAACLALEEASALAEDRSHWGLVVGTGHGSGSAYDFLDSFLQSGDPYASPTHFANSVSNGAAALVAIALEVRGPCLTVSQLDLSFPCALQTACEWLREGRADRVLVGGVDQHHDLVAYSEHRLAHTPEGLAPSEGAAFFLLARAGGGEAGCTLEGVRLGHVRTAPPDFSPAPLVVGHHRYKEIPQDVETRCYSPLFGHLPVGPALDLAVACLCVGEGILFPSPGPGLGVKREVLPLKERSLQLFTCLPSGHYSLLHLSA